jgi:hypothetical protein
VSIDTDIKTRTTTFMAVISVCDTSDIVPISSCFNIIKDPNTRHADGVFCVPDLIGSLPQNTTGSPSQKLVSRLTDLEDPLEIVVMSLSFALPATRFKRSEDNLLRRSSPPLERMTSFNTMDTGTSLAIPDRLVSTNRCDRFFLMRFGFTLQFSSFGGSGSMSAGSNDGSDSFTEVNATVIRFRAAAPV